MSYSKRRNARLTRFMTEAATIFDGLEKWYAGYPEATSEEISQKAKQIRREIIGMGLEVILKENEEDESKESIVSLRDSVHLSHGYPELIREDFQKIRRINIAGRSLRTTIFNNLGKFHKFLKAGKELRCLIPEPADDLSQVIAFRSGSMTDRPDLVIDSLRDTLSELEHLYQRTRGELRVKTIKNSPSYGMLVIEYEDNSTHLYIKMMPFRAAADYPTFYLDSNSGFWFDFFLDQYESQWRAGRLVNYHDLKS